MSTRCQIRISAKDLMWDADGTKDEVFVYHHCDGYPSHMLPEILKGYQSAIAPKMCGASSYDKSWEAGRPGKAAAYIIAVDPGGFEPQSKQDQDFHGDIEYFYEVVASNPNRGASGPKVPRWSVSVYKTLTGFWDMPTPEFMELIAHGDIVSLAKRAKRLEKS